MFVLYMMYAGEKTTFEKESLHGDIPSFGARTELYCRMYVPWHMSLGA
jgi:hypothetical protein